MQLSDIIGNIGVLLILGSYFLLQIQKIPANGFFYSFMNLLGAVLVLISLFFSWNLSATILQIAWILISIWGIFQYFRNRKS